MAYATLRALAFQQTDALRTPIGDEVIVEKGGEVPEWVKPFEISALVSAGVIVDMGERPSFEFAELPPALPNPEVPPTLAGNQVLPSLDVGPDDLASLEGEPVLTEVAEQQGGESAEAPTLRPADSASKAEWEDYAVSQGVDRGEAESMNKRALITAVDQRAQG